MSGESHFPMALSGVCTVGGLMGYAKSKSVPSLVGGLAFGGLYAASAYLINQGKPELGHTLAVGSSLVLAGVMGKRYSRTGAIMPAGALTAVGFTGTAYHGLKLKEWKHW